MDLRIFFHKHPQQMMMQNRKIKKDSSCSQAFGKPTDSESQTDSDNGANDISMNVNIDNRARESDQGDGRNAIADATMGARRGRHGAMPPTLVPCNKVLIPNFQSVIFQTHIGCSLLSLILAKLLLLNISCENIFALSIVTALTACPFSIKKFAEMSVIFTVCESSKKSLATWGYAPGPTCPSAAWPPDPRL